MVKHWRNYNKLNYNDCKCLKNIRSDENYERISKTNECNGGYLKMVKTYKTASKYLVLDY